MLDNDVIFNRIAEALLIDYSSVYYVNMITNEYQWYSIDPVYNSLQIEHKGQDFFANMPRDARQVVYYEDLHIFLEDIRKEKLLEEMETGTMKSLVYRLMVDGKPVWHTLRMIRGAEDYIILGVLNIDKDIRMKQEAEKLEHERELYNQIAASLAEHYDTLYYVNVETGHYIEFSSTDIYKSLHIPTEGGDFFAECRKNIRRVVHPDDQDMVLKLHEQETMLQHLNSKNSVTASYRLIIDGNITNTKLTQFRANDKKHLIVGIENIDSEVAMEESLKHAKAISVTYSQIAEGLADHYDMIYYVDIETEQFTEFSSSNLLQALEGAERGSDFFRQARLDTFKVVYADDREVLIPFLDKEKLLEDLRTLKVRQIEYRLISEDAPVFVRLSAMFTKDRRHLLLCVENIDEQVRRENEQQRALRSATERAMQDELTGAKNKNAYQEYEASLQQKLDAGTCGAFAMVVCDLNNLKIINDTLGHKAGDDCIRAACKLICDVFKHSPVFRVGGDEFVAVLREKDYEQRSPLFEQLRSFVLRNRAIGDGPVVASGIASYQPGKDAKVSEVFDRADSMMYDNKKKLKA